MYFIKSGKNKAAKNIEFEKPKVEQKKSIKI